MRYQLMRVAFIGMLLGSSSAYAAQCPAPPVSTAEQAICYAQEFVAKQKPSWDVGYITEEADNHWKVYYHPIGGQVFGGAGDLQISKATAEVTFVGGYR